MSQRRGFTLPGGGGTSWRWGYLLEVSAGTARDLAAGFSGAGDEVVGVGKVGVAGGGETLDLVGSE